MAESGLARVAVSLCGQRSSENAEGSRHREDKEKHATDDAEASVPTTSRALDANDESKPGTPAPKKRLHVTGNTPTTADDPTCIAVPSAASPCASPIRPKPDAASITATRSLAAPRAAMPTSAHAPHCTLADAMPCVRRNVASASRHAFAAA